MATDLIDTVQLQSQSGDALVELFDITLPSGTTVYIFNGLDDGTNNIYFPDKTLDTDSSTYLQMSILLCLLKLRESR